MAIEGSLQSVDIQDIAQLLNLNRSTGLLHIENATLKGVILYREGGIVNAEVEGMTGEPAAYVLLSQSEGSFHFEIAEHDRPVEIHRSIHDLVLEAARRQDTIKKIRASIKHDNIVFLPLVDVRIPQFRKEFNDFEIALMSEFDGQTDIKDILSRRKESAFEVFYHIYELEKKGHLKRVDIYKLLEVVEFKKLFGKKTDCYISQDIQNQWIDQSMTYAAIEVLEIRTQRQLFGQVPVVVKPNVTSGTIQMPKQIMAQFEVAPGDKVLVKPISNS
jgi:hypothetical protein